MARLTLKTNPDLGGASFLKLPKVNNIICKICVTSADEPARDAEDQKKQGNMKITEKIIHAPSTGHILKP
ncbi:MAG TPA: hypothetical protein VME24_01870 [Alphaproteobacteria bacterium]|nr:hypothetical protein [Alphaproteobacteria bacterium]